VLPFCELTAEALSQLVVPSRLAPASTLALVARLVAGLALRLPFGLVFAIGVVIVLGLGLHEEVRVAHSQLIERRLQASDSALVVDVDVVGVEQLRCGRRIGPLVGGVSQECRLDPEVVQLLEKVSVVALQLGVVLSDFLVLDAFLLQTSDLGVLLLDGVVRLLQLRLVAVALLVEVCDPALHGSHLSGSLGLGLRSLLGLVLRVRLFVVLVVLVLGIVLVVFASRVVVFVLAVRTEQPQFPCGPVQQIVQHPAVLTCHLVVLLGVVDLEGTLPDMVPRKSCATHLHFNAKLQVKCQIYTDVRASSDHASSP
jgi:hypothetical protein